MSTAAQALAAAVGRLREAGVPDPARDARRLLAHALQVGPERLTLALPEPMPPAAAAKFERAVTDRAARRPVSQIIGRRAFWGRAFRVTSDTLDPRPETETLVAAALERPFSRLLDLGTGTGILLLTLLAERETATGLGTDISAAALDVARDNAAALGLGARAEFQTSDWFELVTGRFDMIVSNPPYIAEAEMAALAPELAFEPRGALTDGGDGLGAYRAIAAGAGAALEPGGAILLEIGPTQGAQVAALLDAAGFGAISVIEDLDNRPRVVVAEWPA